MSRKDVSKKQSKTQKVIVPKGTIDPSDNAIIEIPHSLYGQPIVIAKKIDSQKSCKSVTIDDEDEIIRRLSPSNSCSSPNANSSCNAPSTSSKEASQLLNLDEAEMKERQLILKQLQEFHSARRKFLTDSSSMTTRSNVSVAGFSSPNPPQQFPTPITKPSVRYEPTAASEVRNSKSLTSEPARLPLIESARAKKTREDQMALEVIETLPPPKFVAQQQLPPCAESTSATNLVTTAVGTSDDNIRPEKKPSDDASCVCPGPSKPQAESTRVSKWSAIQDRLKSGTFSDSLSANSNSNLPACCRTSNPKMLPSSTKISQSSKTNKRGCSSTSLYNDPTDTEEDDSGSDDSCKKCCKKSTVSPKICGPNPSKPQTGCPSSRTESRKSPKCPSNTKPSTKTSSCGPLPSNSNLPLCCRTSNPKTRISRSRKTANKDCCSLTSLCDDPINTSDSDDSTKMCFSNSILSPKIRLQASKCNQDIEKVRQQLAQSRRTLEKVTAQVYKTLSNSSVCPSVKSNKSLPSGGSNTSYASSTISSRMKSQNPSDNRGSDSRSTSPKASKRNMSPTSLDYSRLTGCPTILSLSKSDSKECCSKSGLTDKKPSISKKCSNIMAGSALCPSEELLKSTAKELKNTLRKLSLNPDVIPLSCCSSTEEPVRDSSCNVSGLNISQRSSKQSIICTEGTTPENYSIYNCFEPARKLDDNAKGSAQLKSSLKLLKKSTPSNFKYCNDRSAQTIEEILFITNAVKDPPGCSTKSSDSVNTSYLMYLEDTSLNTRDASTETDVNIMLHYKR